MDPDTIDVAIRTDHELVPEPHARQALIVVAVEQLLVEVLERAVLVEVAVYLRLEVAHVPLGRIVLNSVVRVVVPRVVAEVVIVLGHYCRDRLGDVRVDCDPAVSEVRVDLLFAQRLEVVAHEGIDHRLEVRHLCRVLIYWGILPVNALKEELPAAQRHHREDRQAEEPERLRITLHRRPRLFAVAHSRGV